MKSFAVLALMALFLTGCAANKKFQDFMSTSPNVPTLIAVLGPPAYSGPMPDGTTLYVWSTSRNVSMGGLPVYQPNNQAHSGTVYSATGRPVGTYSGTSTGGGSLSYTPVYNVEMGCELRVIADASGSARSRVFRGNDCNSLIVDSDAIGSAVATRPPLPDESNLRTCLKEEAIAHIASGKDSTTVAGLIANICEQKTGQTASDFLVSYYVLMATSQHDEAKAKKGK